MPEPTTLSAREWAQERLANTERIASRKSGADRDGWLEDAAYWREIVAALDACGAQGPRGTCATCCHARNNLNMRSAYVLVCRAPMGTDDPSLMAPTYDRRVPDDYSCSLYAPAAVVDEVTR